METALKRKFNFQLTARSKEIIVDYISYLFILLFIFTATDKIWKFDSFQRVMSVMPVIGKFGVYIAYFIPTAEISTSLLLIVPALRKYGLISALSLMVGFTIYLIFMVFYAKDLPCNCGGVISKMSWNQHIFFNVAFILLATIACHIEKYLEIKSKPQNLRR